MQPEDETPEPRLPASPTGRVPAWVVEEARRAEVTGTPANYGPFAGPPVGGPPGYLGGTDHPAGHYGPASHGEPPRRSLAARLAGVGVALALGLAVVFVGADYLSTSRVPPELLGSYAERTDLPRPLGVAHPLQNPSPGFEEAATPLAVPPEITEPHDSWVYREEAGIPGEPEPVLWSPCRPIHYVVNTDGAPDDFLLRVTEVAEEVSAATGLVLTYDGTTLEAVSERREPFLPRLYGDRWAPVLIGWADEDSLAALEGDVAGLAYTHTAIDHGTARFHSVSGQVVLDVELQRYRSSAPYVGVLRHELAHLVGLGHVEDASQLMHPSSPVDAFKDGDRTGLALLGAGPCSRTT